MGNTDSIAVKLAAPLHKQAQEHIGYDKECTSMTELVNKAVISWLEKENKNVQ